jgi:thiol-disulfide isomerase/thioredoxin
MNVLRMLLVLGCLGAQVCGGGESLVVFSASWCGPCQQFKQDLVEDPELIAGYEIDVIDVDLLPDMAEDFAVKSYPTFIVVKVEDDILKPENELRREIGYTGPGKFKRWLLRNR